jgi:hypothetical protein
MKNKNLGVPLSDQDMKGLVGGYESSSTWCIVYCDSSYYACCNSTNCKCVPMGESAGCQSGGSGQTSCVYHKDLVGALDQP